METFIETKQLRVQSHNNKLSENVWDQNHKITHCAELPNFQNAHTWIFDPLPIYQEFVYTVEFYTNHSFTLCEIQ